MKFDKSKLPSRHVSVGVKSAPHRSMYYAMGLKSEDIEKPFFADCACLESVILQGAASFQVVTTPIKGFSISSLFNPIA